MFEEYEKIPKSVTCKNCFNNRCKFDNLKCYPVYSFGLCCYEVEVIEGLNGFDQYKHQNM